MNARRTVVRLTFAGVDISTDINKHLLSLTYTDNEEDKTDDLQLSTVKVAAAHAIGQRVEIYPYLARNMESRGGFYCGGYTQYGRKLAVFPNE